MAPAPEPTVPPPPPPERTAQRPLRAVLWMVLAGVLFVGVVAGVKLLDGRVPAPQAAFLRYALGLGFLVPLIPELRRLTLSAQDWRLFLYRGAAHTLGVILWFYAMGRITIAEVTAMNYLTPVYVTVGAALFLGERLAIRRLLAVVAALAGALIILRPGVRALDPGHLAMLATAVTLAASYLYAKRLVAIASATVVVAMLSLTVTVGLLPFALAVWVPVTRTELGLLFVVAFLATGGHYAMTRAFGEGPMAVTQPVTFLQLVWAVLLGAVVFGEPLDGWVVLGGVVIFGSVTFIAIREAHLRSRARQ